MAWEIVLWIVASVAASPLIGVWLRHCGETRR